MTDCTRRAQQNEAAACGGRAPGEPEELGAGGPPLYAVTAESAASACLTNLAFRVTQLPSPITGWRTGEPVTRPDFRGSGPPETNAAKTGPLALALALALREPIRGWLD